jgi:hypothetical protein
MFADSTYLQLDDGAFDNEDCNQDPINEVNIVDIGGFMTMDENNCFDNVDMPEGSSTPMERTLARLHETMAKITAKCTMGASIKLCDHTTSLLQGIILNIQHLHLAQINESMHLGMVFCQVDDGFRNSINRMKYWHETIMEHLDTVKRRLGNKERFITCTHIWT